MDGTELKGRGISLEGNVCGIACHSSIDGLARSPYTQASWQRQWEAGKGETDNHQVSVRV